MPRLYAVLHIPKGLPPEAIVGVGHVLAIGGAVGLALSTSYWWAGLIAAAGVAGNHIADMVDGTHARATGQCRNGGELLDHFADPLSFSYWMIGLGVSVAVGPGGAAGFGDAGSVWVGLGLALGLVLLVLATAVLTNIKAKITGEFSLARIGPTEIKCLLVAYGLVIAGLVGFGVAPTMIALVFTAGLGVIGLVSLLVALPRAVCEVNRHGSEPDASAWELA